MKRYDSTLDYADFAAKICGSHPCLIMMETKGGEHCHFQGLSDLSKAHIQAIAREFGSNHVLKKRKRENPAHAKDKKFDPVRFFWEEVDWKGFQYCCKEYTKDSVVVFKQGFTEEDLIELHDKSNLHRDVISAKFGEYIAGRIDLTTPGTPEELHYRVASLAFFYYVAEDKMQPPNLKQLVRYQLYKIFRTEAVASYLIRLSAM